MENKLSSKEQEILDLFEQGKLKSVKNTKQKIAAARSAAKQHMKKDQRINIRLSSCLYHMCLNPVHMFAFRFKLKVEHSKLCTSTHTYNMIY